MQLLSWLPLLHHIGLACQSGLVQAAYVIMVLSIHSTLTHQWLCLQVVEFEGKAAVPISGLFKFRKAFFLHPKTDELYGRVDLQKGPLGNALYPLYYKASVAPSLVPGIVAKLGTCISALALNRRIGNCCRIYQPALTSVVCRHMGCLHNARQFKRQSSDHVC